MPGHPSVVVGLGAAHGFKFAPTFGRLLADLAIERRDDAATSRPFRLDRPALTDPDYPAQLAGLTMRHVSAQVAGVDAELGGGQRAHPRRAAGARREHAVVHGRLHGEAVEQRGDAPGRAARVGAA